MGEDSRSQSYRITDILVDRGNLVVAVVVFVSVVMAVLAPSLQMDHSLEAIFDKDSPEYKDYRRFVKTFGNDEFLFFALKNRESVTNSQILQALEAATRELKTLDKVSKVTSISSLKLPEKRRRVFGAYALVENNNGIPSLDEAELGRFRKIWPVIDLLVSSDLKMVGIMVELNEEQVSGSGTGKLIETMK